MTGRIGRAFGENKDEEWGYLFRGEDELVVVRIGEWWRTPRCPVQEWAVIPVDSLGDVDWRRLQWTSQRMERKPRDDQ